MLEKDLKEKPSPNINFLNMYYITSNEMELLKKRVSSRKGTCQIWIHTHHKGDILTDYYQQRDALIKNTTTSNMPIIVLIPFNAIDDYNHYYEELLDNSLETPTIYYVPTFSNDSTPCTLVQSIFLNEENGIPTSDKVLKEEWDKLADIFRRLGVVKMIFSGMYYKKNGEKEEGCVNHAEEQLKKRGFSIFISNVTLPNPNR